MKYADFFERTRAFWVSLFLTLVIFGVAAGILTVDYRCRMMVSPPDGAAASLQFTGVGTRDGKLAFTWFSQEIDVPLYAGDGLNRLSGAIPILIPRSVRTAALLLPRQTEQEDVIFTTRKQLSLKSPS